MNCPDCGAYIGEEDLFCGECGRPRPQEEVTQAAEETVKEQASPARVLPSPLALDAPTPDPQITTTEAPSRRPVLFGLAGLLAVVLCLCIAGVGIWLFVKEDAPPAQAVATVAPGTIVDQENFEDPNSGLDVYNYGDTVAPGTITYQDDFEDPDSGWDVYNYGDTVALYHDGEYRLAVFEEEYVTWGNPDPAQDLGDFVIEVDARAVEGPLDNNMGILLRYQDDNENFYWFQISSDGFFSVDLLEEDDWVTMVGWEESTAIQQGIGVTNRLKVSCSGDEFVFSVNDTYLGTVTDSSLRSGNIGLAAGTFDEAGVVVHFDNLKVYSLEE